MTDEQKTKLRELRCKAWGITEDEYFCNQCGDFQLEDMARAYRRGKNKGADQLTEAKKILKEFVDWANWQSGGNCPSFKSIQDKAEQFLKE